MRRALLLLLLSVPLSSLLLACAGTPAAPVYPTGQPSFALYQRDMRQLLRHSREFQTTDHEQEVDWNSPQEWLPPGYIPEQRAEKAILLVHGLGDSPFSFTDVGPELARQGFLVRSLLLPGHGTNPAHMASLDNDAWQNLVHEQTALLQKDARTVFLGGFSTGANLVTVEALRNKKIAGLVLFSPAFLSNQPYDWITPLLTPFMTWWREPDPSRPQLSPVRYMNVPINGFALFYHSSKNVLNALEKENFDRPALLVLTEHDSVIDVGRVTELFTKRFTHPDSRLIWYGKKPSGNDPRILVKTDYLPEERISRFSHMCVVFSPHNPLYGRDGSLRLCRNGQTEADFQACLRGEAVWYSSWGYREAGKNHARLTFNPYFQWQSSVMRDILFSAGE